MAIDYKIVKKIGVVAVHDDVQLELNYISWGENEPTYDLRAWTKGTPLKGMVLSLEQIKKIKELTDSHFISDIIDQLVPTPKKRGRKPKAVSSPALEKKVEKPKCKIVEFPKIKEEIEPMITEGNATYEQCVEKLNKEREIFKESDSQYVIDGLLELCKVDQNFRNNIMLEEKSYAKAFDYFVEMAKKGYSMKYGGVCYMDNNIALAHAIDYFNIKEA